jgi:hypothetical protein
VIGFICGVVLGALIGLRVGAWWCLTRLAQSEMNTRMARVRHPGRF